MVEGLSLVDKLAEVEERITLACQKAGRRREEVHLLAVTKTMPPEILTEALAAGLHNFGESYVQEFRSKEKAFAGQSVNWHFIGQLQSNKAKYLNNCSMIHSLDSLTAATEISRHVSKPIKVLVEINCGEKQKGGVAPEMAKEFVAQISRLPNLQVAGLMTVPPLWAEGEQARQFFALLAKLRDNISAGLRLGEEFCELSMGMSDDYEIAIAEGATWIRLGSILFGHRLTARWWQDEKHGEGNK